MSVIRVKISSPGNQTWSLLEPLFKQEYTSSGSRWTQEDQRGSKDSTSPEEEGGDLTWAMTWDRKWEKHTRMKSFQFCCGFRIIRPPLVCVCVCVVFYNKVGLHSFSVPARCSCQSNSGRHRPPRWRAGECSGGRNCVSVDSLHPFIQPASVETNETVIELNEHSCDTLAQNMTQLLLVPIVSISRTSSMIHTNTQLE